uniref:WAS/WASL-interacting protein family member 1-like n=1 Tax=Diabrotica virgifera virgifera TaxID=50390 RepID=A0A6P7G2Z2_DIAVI
MPAPPPPPPLAPAAPPPPMFNSSKNSKSSSSVDRGALLKSIQKGAKLKKTVTNDRSAPALGGSSNKPSNGSIPGGMGGMQLPKLPIGGMSGGMLGANLRNGNSSSGGSVSPVSPLGGMKNFGSIQMELKKQLANDNRNRGPPPPTPTRNVSYFLSFVIFTGSNPPSPPPRHSSMSNNNVPKRSRNFDEKFKQMFHSSNDFPSPPPYKNVIKLYSSVTIKPAPVKPVTVA